MYQLTFFRTILLFILLNKFLDLLIFNSNAKDNFTGKETHVVTNENGFNLVLTSL